MNKLLATLTYTMLGAMMISCSEQKKDQKLTVSIDESFTALYMRDSGGVTGADGTISIPLSDGSSLFMTGDCFLGNVQNGKRNPFDKMINNAFIRIGADYTYIASYYKGTTDRPVSLFVPREADTAQLKYWYWPGHGFQRGDKLHLFMTKFYQGGEGQWGFCFGGTDYLVVNMDDYSVVSVEEIYDQSDPVHWGHCVMQDADYYYVYGTRSGAGYDMAQLCVSRAKIDAATGKLGRYEYYDGHAWNVDPASTADLGVELPVSEQFSVFKHGDKYVLITQRKGMATGDIYSFIASSPVGTWGNKKLLYTTTEQDKNKNHFTYNAMAHPQFINSQDELLICYNRNSNELSDVFNDVSTYRPIFLRVPMRMILE